MNWNHKPGSNRIENTQGAHTGGVSITSGASNAKSSWQELVAATAHDYIDLRINMMGADQDNDFLFDIGVGGSGSEVALIENIGGNICSELDALTPVYHFPLMIPAGTRISARAQTTQGTDSVVPLILTGVGPTFDDQVAPYGRVATYGANTGDSGGTQVDPGGTADTYGAWSEITSSCDFDIRAICTFRGPQDDYNAKQRTNFLLDIGAGGSGSEEVVLDGLVFNSDSSQPDNYTMPFSGPFPCHIPAGTRLSARALCGTTDATDRTFDLILYCFG